MNAKALIRTYIDWPSEQRLMYTVHVDYVGTSGQGWLGSAFVDATFLVTDSVAQIKSKIRAAIVADAATRGYTVATADVSSIFQI